jgi:SPP1 family predicted phage head-tail adaptor
MKCCDITPASLNRKITINSLVVTATATGGQSQSFVKLADVWSNIKNMTGSELMRYDQLGAVAMSKFTIRYRADIAESMQIVYRGDDYNIKHIDNLDEADRFLTITAKRGVNS